MPKQPKVKREKKYEDERIYPSRLCNCSWQKSFGGFVPEADCAQHDTKQFLDFIEYITHF